MRLSQVIGNFEELVWPRLKLWLRSWFEKKKRKKREAREAFHVEEDAQLEPYDGVVYEYNTLVLQYGYLTFFAVAFPLYVKRFLFLSHLYIKTIFLPRQARDKHREKHSKTDYRFLRISLFALLSNTVCENGSVLSR